MGKYSCYSEVWGAKDGPEAFRELPIEYGKFDIKGMFSAFADKGSVKGYLGGSIAHIVSLSKKSRRMDELHNYGINIYHM